MLPTYGFEGKNIGVLGLGRSGLAVAKALDAGGATPVCWDDRPEIRTLAERDYGLKVERLDRREWNSKTMDRLVVSPGIPHLYPKSHPVIDHALRHGIPLDNDIGLFFQSNMSGQYEFEPHQHWLLLNH